MTGNSARWGSRELLRNDFVIAPDWEAALEESLQEHCCLDGKRYEDGDAAQSCGDDQTTGAHLAILRAQRDASCPCCEASCPWGDSEAEAGRALRFKARRSGIGMIRTLPSFPTRAPTHCSANSRNQGSAGRLAMEGME